MEKLFFSNIPMEINIEFYSIVIGMLYAPSSTFAHKVFVRFIQKEVIQAYKKNIAEAWKSKRKVANYF